MFAAVVWFTCYNTVVSSDKFLYIFGKILPSIALIVSMTLSLIPKLLSQVKVIADSQRTLGMDWKSGSAKQRVVSGARILSGSMIFYPTTVWPEMNFVNILLYGAFFALGILPSVIQLKEDRKWKQLK